jgi:alanyl-tRNA synthetase
MSSQSPSPVTSPEIVSRYLGFFQARGHLLVPGGPLVLPGSDTSFVIAGMQPMLPYLLGREQPPAPCLTDLQRCLRTDDVDAVGANARKMTSFHMLGNWSIGGYGRREAIGYARELLALLGIDLESLWITTFAGDPALGLPPDEIAPREWLDVGIPAERIVPLGMDDNFWSMGGPGPCGPDTEMFVDRGAELGCGLPTCRPGCECDRFLEIWNLVFIEYDLLPGGRYEPLPLRSVDTGMGLDRVASVLQDVPTVFETDVFVPARRVLNGLTPHGADLDDARERRARHIIVDHVRATLLAWLAGVGPDRDGRGSVVRRLIRRAARQGRILGIERPFLANLIEPLVVGHGDLLAPDERLRTEALVDVLGDEERRFARVLTAGLRRLEHLTPDGRGLVPGAEIFALLGDHGFPPDLAEEVLADRGLTVDWESYRDALARHREVSRAGGFGPHGA